MKLEDVDPRRVAPPVRRLLLIGTIAGLLWLPWRFRIVAMPEGAGSPVVGVAAGERMLVDRRPGAIGPRDLVLFEHEGTLLLGRAEPLPPASARTDWPASWQRAAERDGAFWIAVDRADVPSSASFGPLDPARVRGRVVMVW